MKKSIIHVQSPQCHKSKEKLFRIFEIVFRLLAIGILYFRNSYFVLSKKYFEITFQINEKLFRKIQNYFTLRTPY